MGGGHEEFGYAPEAIRQGLEGDVLLYLQISFSLPFFSLERLRLLAQGPSMAGVN